MSQVFISVVFFYPKLVFKVPLPPHCLRNGLTQEQCFKNPGMAATHLCSGFDYPLDLCLANPAIAGLRPCQGKNLQMIK